MIIVRAYKETDFEEITRMYYELLKDVYPSHNIKPIQFACKNVLFWIDSYYDIIVAEDNGNITGFGLCFMDNIGGVVDDYYKAEIMYVKPEYRKGRSAYILIHSAINYAESQKVILSANASNITESSKICSKIGKPVFINYERVPNGND